MQKKGAKFFFFSNFPFIKNRNLLVKSKGLSTDNSKSFSNYPVIAHNSESVLIVAPI